MLATMIFACFARSDSLKPTVKTLETIGGSLPNLGIEGIPSRSNLGKSPRARKRNGHALPYKLFRAGRIYDRAAVQGSLGSGELLQVAEAEPGDRIVHGDLQERRGNTDLRFHDIHAPVERTQEGFGQQT